MKSKRVLALCCLAVFVLCSASLVLIALRAAYSTPVIGGAGMPTFLFSFRQLLRSPVGIIISAAGVFSLAAAVILSVKK